MGLNLTSVKQALLSFRDDIGKPEMMIVGSLSLHLSGFDIEVNDIDLVIYCPQAESLEKLRFLTSSSLCDTRNYSNEENPRYDFFYRGIKFNVWVRDHVEEDRRYTFWNYYRVSNVVSTVRVMQQYGRSKDYVNLINLAIQLLSN